MKKLLKPANIAFYFLMLLVFFVLGLYYAGYIEAGKNQGLAGGAIVLGYGVLFGGIAFVASFFIAYYVATKKIIIINWILLVTLLATCGYKYYEFKQRDALQKERNKPYQQKPNTPKTVTEPVEPPTALLFKNESALPVSIKIPVSDELGLGFFKHNFFEHPTLYFYGNVTLEKAMNENVPEDSLSFTKDQYGDFKLVSAPPWLLPAHQNTQFGIVYFKLNAISYDLVKVEVNSQNGREAYLDLSRGETLFWPKFLLSAEKIELLDTEEQMVKIKPQDNAGEVLTKYAFMKPLLVEEDWIHVLLKDNNLRTVNKGWVRWKKDGELLVKYTLSNIEQ